jgi:DNA-binding GntR family transcriptional regulator
LAEFATKLDLAERRLLQLIASGEIGPGEPIRQSHLAERMGISPTPVREALRRLEAQGLVVLEPHRGVRVAEVEPHEMGEIYEIRAALEGLAVEHAVPRLTLKQIQAVEHAQARLEKGWAAGDTKQLAKLNYQFHTGIYRMSGRPRLIRMIDSLWPLFPHDSMWAIPGRGPGIVKEHRAVLDAIRAGDAEGAHQAMRVHMEAGAVALLAFRDGADGRAAAAGPTRRRPSAGRDRPR